MENTQSIRSRAAAARSDQRIGKISFSLAVLVVRHDNLTDRMERVFGSCLTEGEEPCRWLRR